MLRRPSAMLIRQNGIRMATSTKMMPKSPGLNQIAARIAQPIEGNELSTGLLRSSTTPSSQDTPLPRNAMPPPISTAPVIKTRTREAPRRAGPRPSRVQRKPRGRNRKPEEHRPNEQIDHPAPQRTGCRRNEVGGWAPQQQPGQQRERREAQVEQVPGDPLGHRAPV